MCAYGYGEEQTGREALVGSEARSVEPSMAG